MVISGRVGGPMVAVTERHLIAELVSQLVVTKSLFGPVGSPRRQLGVAGGR
jgi:hypothetical protein